MRNIETYIAVKHPVGTPLSPLSEAARIPLSIFTLLCIPVQYSRAMYSICCALCSTVRYRGLLWHAAAAEEHGFDTQTTAEGASKSGDGTTDHQFNSILRNAGLHVRTEVGSEAPAAAVVPQNHAFYAPTDIQHQEPQHIMSDSAFVTDSQSQAMPLGTDHLENAEHRPHAEHPYAEHPHVEYPQYPASAAHSSAAGVSVAADMQVKSTNDAITAAPPPDMHEVPPSASDMRAPDESEGGTQGRNGLVTGVDADSAAQDILAPGMGALAGLAGMVGWGKKSHQGDPAQNHSRSASQLSQQLPDPATLTPPEAEFTPPPKAPAAEESLGGFPAAFALTRACPLQLLYPAKMPHAQLLFVARVPVSGDSMPQRGLILSKGRNCAHDCY